MKKSYRIQIAEDTLDILKKGHYINKSKQSVSVRDAQANCVKASVHYTDALMAEVLGNVKSLLSTSGNVNTVFEVIDATTLEAARSLTDQGVERVMALNFASAKNPGGGFLNGSQAQEESLARSSGLYPCLGEHMAMYHINRGNDSCLYTDDMIYSPDVPVIKDDEGDLLDKPYLLSIITAPAVNAGAVVRNEPQHVDQIAPYMMRRMEKVLALTLAHGHKNLILGAWGCGVFQNDPKDVAAYFSAHLKEGKFKNRFERVVFAIKSKEERFIEPFKAWFA